MISAVIVTYEPDLAALQALLKSLRSQVSSVIVVDNGSSLDVFSGIDPGFPVDSWCEVIRLPTNLGIAAAQNVGIKRVRQQGADFLILFDQDSVPAPDMVERLAKAAENMEVEGHAVAAVGPRYVDARQNNPPPFIRLRGLHLERCACTDPYEIVPVDYLIASGCLIPMTTIDAVGDMTEALFIDYVDIEWGLRAKSQGFQSFGVCSAAMEHDLGEQPINFLGRKIPMHSPLRHYYLFRNAVWLYRQAGPPLRWKLADAWRLMLKYGFYTLFARPRLKHLRMMTLGIWHGLGDRLGRYGDG